MLRGMLSLTDQACQLSCNWVANQLVKPASPRALGRCMYLTDRFDG